MSEKDSLFDEFGDFVHEVPEAEDAIRKYREHRQRQSLAVARHMVKEKERLAREKAWEELRLQYRATYLSGSIH